MIANPYQQYKEQSLNTMSSGEILVKLYDECIKQLHIAQKGILEKDFARTNDALTKTQEIIDTLSVSLNMSYEVSKQLRPMYVFLSQQTMQANLKKDATIIAEILPFFKDLRDSFDEAQKATRRPQGASVGGRAV